jgi:hypothetical protein
LEFHIFRIREKDIPPHPKLQAVEAHGARGNSNPYTLDLGTRWNGAVSFSVPFVHLLNHIRDATLGCLWDTHQRRGSNPGPGTSN